MQKLFRSLIAVAGLAGLAACGDDVSVTAPNNPLVITGAPVTAVSVGDKVQLSASEAATWASSAANVASVDANGLVTAAAAGTASITATATADVNKKASVTITVVAPAVRSVTVSPSAVTMNPGGTQGFVANVDADPGVARTVTWTSSNQAVVTITAAGVATAVAPGAATITATSTANTSVAGAASVTVRTPTAASVTIEKVTVGNTNVPVNFLAVVGQMDVTVNVDPGDFILSKVELLVDGVVCPGCTQSFTAAQSQALSAAAVYGDDVAGAVSQILFSVQTSQFDAAGKPTWTNKTHTVSARATLTNAGQTSTASSNRDMTFANVDTWVATLAFTGTTASATGTSGTSAGLAYRRGGLTVTALPVIYTEGLSIVAAGSIVRFGSGCDASGNGQRNVPLTGTGPFTAAFPQTVPSGGSIFNTVSAYEFSSGACAFLNGETPILVGVDNSGNNIFNGIGPCIPGGVNPPGQFCPPNSVAAVRLDNRAPGVPQFAGNPNGRQNGWINDAVGLTGSNTSNTDNDWIINGTADAGVGGGAVTTTSYLRFLRIGDGADGTVSAARSATASDAPVLPAPTAANNSLCAIITARDELGNESTIPSSSTTCQNPPVPSFAGVGTGTTHLRFGVDIDEPTIDYDATSVAAPATGADVFANARLNGATFGTEFVVTVADIGSIGVSGMLAGTPVKATVIRREADGTNFTPTGATSDCVVGTLGSSNTVCNQSALLNTGGAGLGVALPLVNTLISPQTIDGFYTFNATAFDAAGNFTPIAAPRVAVSDDTPPSLTTALFNVPLNGPTVVFNANASDNLDLWFARYMLTYAGGLAGPLIFPDVQINTFNAATLMNSNIAAGITVNGFMRQVENVTANGPLAVGGAFKPVSLDGFVSDQANNASVNASTPIPGASVTNGVSYVSAAAAQCPGAPPASVGCLTRSWAVTTPAAAVNVSANNTTVCGAPTPATATNVLLTADAFGPTATYNSPFTRVDFYVLFGGNLVRVGAGSPQAIFDDGSAFGRRHRWTFDFTPGATYGCAPTVLTIYAVGVNGVGDGLVTLANANITVVP
jgi:hypothetical protein